MRGTGGVLGALLRGAAVLVALAGTAQAAENVQIASIAATEAVAMVPDAPPVPQMVARVDLSDQTMRVYVDNVLTYSFAVSTGRKSYGTPVGRYQAEWLSPKHRSRKYNNAPMPWAVFFHDGFAVHGTTEVRKLGRPASHGCVRLHTDNAKLFYKLVKTVGMDNTLITIVR